MKLFNFNSKKKPTKPGAKKAPKKKFILSRKQKIIAIVGGVLVLGGAGYGVYAAYTMDEVSAGGCVSNIYKKGAVKTCVKYAQQMLGMSNADSSFGTDTYNKVKAFQSKYDLTVDGTIGPKTWDKLCTKGVNATAKKNAGCDGSKATTNKKWKAVYMDDLCSVIGGSIERETNKDGSYNQTSCFVKNHDGSKNRYRMTAAYPNDYTNLCRAVAKISSKYKWDSSLTPQGMYFGRTGMMGMCVKEA